VNHKDHRSVGALLAVDSPDLQASLVDAFHAVEIPSPLTAANPAKLREILGSANLDLIVMSSVLDGAYVAPMITEIRRGKLGPHPFPIVVVLVSDTDPAAVRQVSNCGPDDIVPLPCAPQDLLDRINVFLAGARRPLVVNDGYAGPERRNLPRD
jgi:DNA-binding response OmpR family regulator